MSEAQPTDAAAAAPAPAGAEPTIILPSFTGAWGHTAIISLWVPVVVFAHAFAAFWLFKTWMLNSPAMQRRTRAQARNINRFTKAATLKLRGSIVRRDGKAAVDDAAVAGDQVAIQVRLLCGWKWGDAYIEEGACGGGPGC